MEEQPNRLEQTSKRIKPWMYIAVLFVNVLAFLSIGKVYLDYTDDYSTKLFDENIQNVDSLNLASAHASDTYITGMNMKIDDLKYYIEHNNMRLSEAVRYLAETNRSPARQFQLVLCGSYGPTGELSFGDYTGVSIRTEQLKDGNVESVTSDIAYGSGYYEIYSAFTNALDAAEDGLCYVPEFTDPDTKEKCFAVYRHLTMEDDQGQKKLYALLQMANSQAALSAYQMQKQYDGQSSVLIDQNGAYIIKDSDFRNANFFDYIVNYNGLSLDWRGRLMDEARSISADGQAPLNLFYRNHRGEDCVFSLARTDEGWYSVTCVPLSSFRMSEKSVDYSLMILLLFVALFLFDAVVIYLVGRVMSYNVTLAEQTRLEAISANQAKSRFLSSMSHELRTPLNAIIGFAALSEDSMDDRNALRDYIKKIGIASRLLLQLISDILDVSAIESNKMKLTNSEFDIGRLLSALSVIYYDQCAKKGVEFSAVLRDIRTEILIGDSVRVNQLLLNYLSNAVKFTPAGGKVTLRASQVRREKDTVTLRFEVIDTGCGVSEELKSRLFQPFERENGDASRRYGGSGLGLSIVKNLTGLMGGTFGVESTEGKGSCFWVELPFAVPEHVQQNSFSPLKNLSVVVACGNADEREYIGQILESFGVEFSLTDAAGDAKARLSERIRAQRPVDVCMLDWKTSDLSAPDAAGSIRRELGDNTPHIMILAYDVSTAKLMCAAADSVFGKPIFRSTLYNALVELTDGGAGVVPDTRGHFDWHGKRALLVEDNRMNAEIAQLQLKKVGLEVDVAEDGRKGYERFCGSPDGYYDVILMDVQMPVMNGYEATEAIRASSHPQAQTVPILAMTADAFAEDVKKAYMAGMNEHLPKPIDPNNLYTTLGKYLS